MIDIKLIREDPQRYHVAAQNKRMDVDIEKLLELDAQGRRHQQRLQELATEKNRAGKSIAQLQGQAKQDAVAGMTALKQEQKQLETQQDHLKTALKQLLLRVPQPADPDVPVGPDESANIQIKRWGEVPGFDFEPKDHVQLGADLGLIDIDRGVKLAGSRSYFLTGAGAMLEWAVLRFAFDYMVHQRGYIPMIVPVIVRDKAMEGTGYYPGGEEQAYRAERDEMSLVGTAEVPLTAYHHDEILEQSSLPRKYVALSPCFRREAGTYGKDTAGLYRIHQFQKVEQFILCQNDIEQSKQFHLEILENSEAVLQAIKLPYRVVDVCTGDLGQGQVQKFDIETWMPSRGSYGETHSASRFYQFQARRLEIRYRDDNNKMQFCHTLNNTVIASPRILIPILELNQNKDGSITVPDVLRPYMNGMERIEKRH